MMKKRQLEQITRGEIKQLARGVKDESLKKWADMSSNGPYGEVVFADKEQLDRCRAERGKRASGKPDEDVQG